MFGIYCGSYLVVETKTLGGACDYDIVLVVGGHGTISEPWKVKSTTTSKTFTVSAMDILKDSYRHNYSRADAEVIYHSITSKTAPDPQKPTITDMFDANPF